MEIVFSDKSLTNMQKEQMKMVIKKEAGNFILILQNLDKLILTENYIEEIKAVRKELRNSTEGLDEVSLEQSLGLTISNKSKSVVLINKSCWSNLISGDKDLKNFCLHVINHEMVHVEDNSLKSGLFEEGKGIFSEASEQDCVSELHFFLRHKANQIWSEYNAERKSTTTITEKFILRVLRGLETGLDIMKDFLQENIDIDNQRYFDLRVCSLELLEVFAKMLGICHGLKDRGDSEEATEVCDYIREIIKDDRILKTWDSMEKELMRLYRKYPEWNDWEELDDMSALLLENFDRLEIQL